MDWVHEHLEAICKWLSTTLYGISGGFVLGDLVSAIDQHTWIIGAILGTLTLMTNFYFKLMHLRLTAARIGEADE